MISTDRPAGEASTARLMDLIYRHQRHIYDATRKFYLLGRDRLIAELRPPPGGAVLEVGCGTARNLILAARRCPSVSFWGIDISAEMLATARANVDAAGLSGRIALARADATSFDAGLLFGRQSFDRIYFSYSLSMIPDWRQAIVTAVSHLEPNGRLLAVDFGEQQRLPGLFRRLLYAWLARFHVRPRAGLDGALRQAAATASRHSSAKPLYRGYAIFGEVGPAQAQ
jgi:S-adenosylmethionine-diacylgycerolhomoserine-N-methlytransferase